MIDGIPDGFELVRIGVARHGDLILSNAGRSMRYTVNDESKSANYIIVKVIEPEYRPFANAAEFAPHRERWITRDKHDPARGCYRVSAYDEYKTYTNDGFRSYEDLFCSATFADGTPCGVAK